VFRNRPKSPNKHEESLLMSTEQEMEEVLLLGEFPHSTDFDAYGAYYGVL